MSGGGGRAHGKPSPVDSAATACSSLPPQPPLPLLLLMQPKGLSVTVAATTGPCSRRPYRGSECLCWVEYAAEAPSPNPRSPLAATGGRPILLDDNGGERWRRWTGGFGETLAMAHIFWQSIAIGALKLLTQRSSRRGHNGLSTHYSGGLLCVRYTDRGVITM